VVITLLGATWIRLLIARGHIKVWHLWVNGLMYISYLIIVLG